jgi:hypothetical protein
LSILLHQGKVKQESFSLYLVDMLAKTAKKKCPMARLQFLKTHREQIRPNQKMEQELLFASNSKYSWKDVRQDAMMSMHNH